MRKIILTLAALIGFASLAAPPDEPDFGPRPTPAQMKIQMDNFRASLKDPFSAQIINPILIGKYKTYKGLINGGGYRYGWLTSFGCNGKNSYGAFTGMQSEYRFFTQEKGTVKVFIPNDFDKDNLIESVMEPLIEKVTVQGLASTAKFKSGIFTAPMPQGLFIVRIDPASPNRHLVNRIIISINDKSGSNDEMTKMLLETISASEDGSPVKIKTMDLMGLAIAVVNLFLAFEVDGVF